MLVEEVRADAILVMFATAKGFDSERLAGAAPAASAPAAAAPAAASPAAPSKDYPAHTVLQMPALSPTMTTGNLAGYKVSKVH